MGAAADSARDSNLCASEEDLSIARRAATAIREAIPETRRVWLFGSRANGKAGLESDFDIVFSVDSDRRLRELNVAAHVALFPLVRKHLVAFDAFSVRDSDMRFGNDRLGPIPSAALADGVEI